MPPIHHRPLVHLTLEVPALDVRNLLWRQVVPSLDAAAAESPVGPLAERYQLSGGFIKVACERAANVAGSNHTEIDEDLLRLTIERMYRERGKLSSVGPLD